VPRPGVDVEVVDEVVETGAILDTGQGFFIGETERGPNWGRARSLKEYENKWGSRMGGPLLYDGVSPFFEEGGGSAIISRMVAEDAATATIPLGTAWVVNASGAGAWGNDIDVATRQPTTGSDGTAGQPVFLEVTYLGDVVERSPTLYDTDSGITWAENNSDYISLAPGSTSILPIKDTSVSLAGGTDGTPAVDDASVALSRFTYDQGPGQVQAPGLSDPLVHYMIGEHCEDYHRVGLVDLEDTDDKAVLIAARTGFNGKRGSRLLLACGSWYSYPLAASPASRLVPLSGVEAGIIARVDRGGDKAAVAAGTNGVSRRALGLSHNFSDADREELNANGVTLGRQFGLVRTYGYRTAAGPDYNDNWTFFQESRVVMAVAHECNAAAEDYVFDTIDGLGHIFVQLKNVLVGIVQKYWQAGALYGATPEAAFRVVCDFSVNPIETIKLGEIHAAVFVRTSKIGEWIKIEIVKVPTDREV
jgi:hypothetical protein